MIIMSKNTAKATSNPKRPGRPLVPGSANWLKVRTFTSPKHEQSVKTS